MTQQSKKENEGNFLGNLYDPMGLSSMGFEMMNSMVKQSLGHATTLFPNKTSSTADSDKDQPIIQFNMFNINY